ncbi:insulinase family protein [Lachnospiraceae bacterium 48-42]
MEIGEKIYGFEVKEKKYVREVEGDVIQMEHLSTGAQVIVIDNQDVKKSFLVGFRTIPKDSTGVFHILEHSVLNGSRRYPDKAMFVNLMKHSMAEFVNAITYPDHTVYPFCTENEKDFMNLTDVYLNAVFCPNVLTDKEIFEQEGWHFQCEDGKAPEINGVVYNEMKGVFSSLDSILEDEMSKAMFPETAYRFVSGGFPDTIPALSYEDFLEYYRTFYNASNCCIVLYGKMNTEQLFEYIDKVYLGKMKRSEPAKPVMLQKPVKGIRNKLYDKEKFGDQGVFASCTYSLGDFDNRERMNAVYILIQAIMGEDEAPMKKGLIQSLGIPEIQYFIMDGIRQPYLAVKIKNTDKETAGRLKTVITEQADRLCREGIGEEVLVSAINRLEFWMREKGGSQPEGIEYVLDIAGGWAQGTGPCEMIEFEETYRKMRTLVKEGYFESLLREILLENDHEAEVSLEPLEKAEEKRQTEEETEDLPGLSADDLLHKKEEPLTRAEEESGITYLKQEIPSKGVAYQSCYFDISDLEPEKVPYAKLFSELLGSLPTRTHSLEELVIEKNMWLGNIRAYLEAYTKTDDIRHVRLKFVMDISCLEQNLMRAVKLGEELLYDTILEHPEIILKRIRQSRMELERGFVTSGNSYASGRAAAHYMLEGAARERYNGIHYYQFLGKLQKNFDAYQGQIIRELKEIQEKLCRKSNLVMSFTGTEKAYGDFRQLSAASGFCGSAREREPGWYQDKLLPGKSEAFIIPSEVSYVALGVIGEYTGEDYLLGRMVSFDYLWAKIRAEGGAYGCQMSVLPNQSWTMSSYRDPNVKRTIEAFRNTSSWLKDLELGEQELLNYKIGAVAGYDRTPKTYVQAKRMDSWYLRQEEPQVRAKVREGLLKASEEDLKNRRQAMESFAQEGTVCVFGNRAKIEDASGQFDNVTVLME